MSSDEAWKKLETTFANKSSTRMLSLLTTLMKTFQEGHSVADFMQSVKVTVDALAMISHPLSDKQIIAYTLNGLGNDFKE